MSSDDILRRMQKRYSAAPDTSEEAVELGFMYLRLLSDGSIEASGGDTRQRMRPGETATMRIGETDVFKMEYYGWLLPQPEEGKHE